jgi:nucleoside-diphosphate kinase
MKMVQLDDAIINEHYAHLVDKPFFPRFREYMKRTPVVVMAIR